MKPSNQVHRNCATKRAPLQTKTRASDSAKPAPFAPPKENDDLPCICIYDRETRKPVQIVPLTSEELKQALTQCLKPEIPQKTSVEFIAAAVREKLVNKPNYFLSQMENAKAEANSLLQLLADNLEYQSQSGCEFTGKSVEEFCFGVSQLVSRTKDRLNHAFEEMLPVNNYSAPKAAPPAA